MRVRHVLLLSAVLLAACRTDPPVDPPALFSPNRMLEEGRGSPLVLPRGTVVGVDPRDDLVLSFTRTEPPAADVPEPGLLTALKQAEILAKERAENVAEFARTDPGDAAAVKTMQEASAAFNRKVTTFVLALRSRGFVTDDELRGLGAGGFPAIAALLRTRVERFGASALQRRELAGRREVTVRARVGPLGKDAKWLHIDNYDELPSGKMEPQYGKFLGVSQSEIAGLSADLRQVEAIAAVLARIQQAAAAGLDPLQKLMDGILQAAERLGDALARGPTQELNALALGLRTFADDATQPEPARTRARAAADAANALLADLATANELAQSLRTLRNTLSRPSRVRVSDLLAPGGAVMTELAAVATRVNTLSTALQAWPDRLATTATAVADLAATHPDLVLPPAVRTFVAELRPQLQPLLDLLARVAHVLAAPAATQPAATPQAGVRDLLAAGELADARLDKQLFHPLSDAPDARLSLRSTDVKEGDRLTIEAIYRTQGETDERLHPRESWHLDVARYGIYATVGAELIFARADTGTADAKEWKPNAAATAEVHHRIRYPNWLGEVWNALDPAVGVHIASLDQGDDSIEFGMGFNASLFGGFVTAGVGWNLSSVDDREYYFLGIDLLAVLQGANDVVGN